MVTGTDESVSASSTNPFGGGGIPPPEASSASKTKPRGGGGMVEVRPTDYSLAVGSGSVAGVTVAA